MTLTDVGASGEWSHPDPSTRADHVVRSPPITLTMRSAPKPRRITPVGAGPSWTGVIDRLNALLALPAGWDSYGAAPVEVDSASATLAILKRLQGVPWPDISADPNGKIELEWAGDDVLLVLVVSGTFSQPLAKVLFDWGSGCDEWLTTADDDDKLELAFRKLQEAH